MKKRHLLNFDGMSRREFDGILRLAGELKQKQQRGISHALLAGKQLAMVFEKPSLRTRSTFAVGITQLGGSAVYLGPAEVGLGTRETPADCARNLDRWFDLITVRTFGHKIIEEMAEYSAVPVINSLTDSYHPCQVLADCQTLIEHKGVLEG
ncbi:MAG TPA: ornithine carbamoyltransferase, partial [Candidatus Binatia bacterium]